jgi:energy-coupling factor transporter transmembrane protein EcfT
MPSRPLRFRAGESVLHRLGAGWKLLLASVIGGVGLALDALPWIAALIAVVMAGYALAGLRASDLWRDMRWLLLQAAIVALLTVAVRGADALAAGTRTGLQLVLVFLPFALTLRTTATESLLAPLRRRLPERLSFALGATFRLLPVFVRELAELVEMQRLRGARLRPRDLWRPGAWRDALSCVAFPMTVRAVTVAEEAAEAAEIRGIGVVAAAAEAAPMEDVA